MNRGLLCIAIPVLLSTGCATNVIRLERASALGEAGEAAATSTRALLREVGAANREKLIAVATLDPACRLPTPTLASAVRTDARICVPSGSAPRRGDLVLRRFDARAFAPSVTIVEALAAYLGAVDAILTEKRVDAGAELDEVLTKLQGAAGDMAAIAGADLPPALTGSQQAALTGALSLVSELANEARTVDELRRLETPAQDERFARTVAGLRRVNDGLTVVLREELEQQRKVLELTRATTPTPRADRVKEMALIERSEDIAGLGPALTRTLNALERSRTDYLALLRDRNAKLTDEERERRARVAQDRVLAALGSLAKLARAF
jgi:hypothetical protein